MTYELRVGKRWVKVPPLLGRYLQRRGVRRLFVYADELYSHGYHR